MRAKIVVSVLVLYREIPDKISDFIGQVILKQALIDFHYFFKISGLVEAKRTTLLNNVIRGMLPLQ
jgi:hypothetical protein